MPPASRDSQIRQAFEVFDTDKSGTLTVDELAGVLTSPGGGAPMTPTEARQFVAKFDANGDGVLTQEEIGEFGGSSRGGVDSRARRGIQRPSQR